MKALHTLALAVALPALAACNATTGAVGSEQPPKLLVSQNAAPGPVSVSAANASNFFKAMCVDTLPSFKGTKNVAARSGFVQHASFRTFYHTELDLSVKLLPENGGGVCSMVFTSKDSEKTLAKAISATHDQASLSANGKALGKDFYRARLDAQ